MKMLIIGDKAPLTTKIQDSDGNSVSLADRLGKPVVLYFYPKDDTPGCTKEACSFRDWNKDIQKLGVHVIGVSKDSPASHQKFAKKYHLNFELWSDQEHKLMEAFGTWQEKKFMGRKYMGTTRSTFVLDSKGKILKVWEKVNPLEHGKEIYEFLETLV
ncbi:MAG: thioredoxin-dependent thiol peroxidase [Candidatus Yanofskybacteria bacterium]|nr:thioredoxin-dependent thiol peroxidase [Candidatus Yanofskybacteria bacterium]